ncbi:MAG: hypothetical protein ACTSO4_16410 [Promethearchaeota archaeon]
MQTSFRRGVLLQGKRRAEVHVPCEGIARIGDAFHVSGDFLRANLFQVQ